MKTIPRLWIASALTAVSLALGWASPGLAQDKDKKDEGLEKLLEKLDETKLDKPKDADKSKEADKVNPKDQALDKLLEGLGQSTDKPAPDDKKPGTPDPAPKPDDANKPDPLKDADKELDKILEGLNGKKPPKPKKDRDKKEEEGGGPLGQVIKEMRDVEERLGQPDTGEQTRKKQTEIVKNLDTLIEQLKNSPSQSQGMKMLREGKQPGNQPGQPQSQPGATAQNGTNQTRPDKPRTPPALLEIAREVWGQLPAQYRDEMSNVMNEHPLPTKADLISLYYKSLSKKSAKQEE